MNVQESEYWIKKNINSFTYGCVIIGKLLNPLCLSHFISKTGEKREIGLQWELRVNTCKALKTLSGKW